MSAVQQAKTADGGSKGGAIYLIFLGVVLAAAGSVFMWMMWRGYQDAKAMWGWPKVEAEVLVSEIRTRQSEEHLEPEHQLRIEYGYVYEGQPYTSSTIQKRGNRWLRDKKKVEKLQEAYPVGSKVDAWVDEIDPEFAVLRPDTKASGYTIWFPAIFVLGGFGMIVGASRNLIGRSKAARQEK